MTKPKLDKAQEKVRLYRFLNFGKFKYGEVFAMCDKCKASYKEPNTCIMEKIADKTDWICNHD